MSQSATPATQNDMTTCLETFEKEMFCSFPHRHGDTATCLENQRLETRHVGAAKRAFRARRPPILILSARYQTGWNVTKCHACHAKRHDNLLGNLRKGKVLQLPHRHGDASRKPETRDETRGHSKTSISCETSSSFRHVIKQVGMSQSATPATQNDMTTCLETFEKERFCSFPHRHGINDPTTTRRRPDQTLEANKGPAPRPPRL